MDNPNSLLDAVLMRCIISSNCNYYTNILNTKEKKEMDELTDLKDKIVNFIAFNNSTKDLVIKKLLYLLDSMKELNKKNDTNPYIDWAGGDTSPEYKRVTYYLRYTVKNNIVKMKYHKYYEAKRKEKYFIVYIRTDNLESAIKFDGDDRSIPSSVWTCLDNFFILSGKEEYMFCDAVDTVVREANSLDK